MTSAAAAQEDDRLDDATRSTVRSLAEEGGELYQQGEYAEALSKLERAYGAYPVPSIGLYSARCLEALGRWVEASERYVEVTRLPVPTTAAEVHRRAQQNAADARQKLLPRLPMLRIDVRGAAPTDVVLRVDGVELKSSMIGLPRPADPGEHVIVAERWGDVLERRTILKEGHEKSVELVFEPREPPPPPSGPQPPGQGPPDPGLRITSYVFMGLGGAGLIAGAVTGGLLLAKEVELADECLGDDQCPASLNDDIAFHRDLRLPTTILLSAGGALAATGLVLFLVSPDPAGASPDEVSVTPLVGPGYLGLTGTF